jgi:hypothetical protein
MSSSNQKVQDRLKQQKRESAAEVLKLAASAQQHHKQNNLFALENLAPLLSTVRFPHYIRSIATSIAETFIYSKWSITSSMGLHGGSGVNKRNFVHNNLRSSSANNKILGSQLELNKQLVPEVEVKSSLFNFLVVHIARHHSSLVLIHDGINSSTQNEAEDEKEEEEEEDDEDEEYQNNKKDTTRKLSVTAHSPPSSSSSSSSLTQMKSLLLPQPLHPLPAPPQVSPSSNSHCQGAKRLCLSPDKILNRILEAVGDGVDNPRIV